ncbi:hypothetical protein [Aestuariivirga sp.]|uniref:hypothetical protein n=1 Tax=Aestuariivirga sp. TaxID=2650926 RepID=UPI003BA922D1
MKVILGIFCGLVVLFAGGCAIFLVSIQFSGDSGAAPLALIPGAVAVLNLLVLLALLGKYRAQSWVFYVLAGVDVLAAIAAGIFWSSVSYQVQDIWTLALPVIAVLLLKAVLTVIMAGRLPPPQSP